MEHVVAGIGASYRHKFLRSIQTNDMVSQRPKMVEVPAGSTTKIKNGIRVITLDRIEERCIVLADVVIPGCPYRKLDSSLAVMQAADHGLGDDATKPFDWSADRRILG